MTQSQPRRVLDRDDRDILKILGIALSVSMTVILTLAGVAGLAVRVFTMAAGVN